MTAAYMKISSVIQSKVQGSLILKITSLEENTNLNVDSICFEKQHFREH